MTDVFTKEGRYLSVTGAHVDDEEVHSLPDCRRAVRVQRRRAIDAESLAEARGIQRDDMRKRVKELEAESKQWQESCGQNYVRATEAEMREEALKERMDMGLEKHRQLEAHIAKLEAALLEIRRAPWMSNKLWTVEDCAEIARKALEKDNG